MSAMAVTLAVAPRIILVGGSGPAATSLRKQVRLAAVGHAPMFLCRVPVLPHCHCFDVVLTTRRFFYNVTAILALLFRPHSFVLKKRQTHVLKEIHASINSHIPMDNGAFKTSFVSSVEVFLGGHSHRPAPSAPACQKKCTC